jgi:hypothetical protein
MAKTSFLFFFSLGEFAAICFGFLLGEILPKKNTG